MQFIPVIELSKYCPGMVTAMGVSMGLTAGAIMSRGSWAQKDRWALPSEQAPQRQGDSSTAGL